MKTILVYLMGLASCAETPTTGKFFYASFPQTNSGYLGHHVLQFQTSNGAIANITASMSSQQSQMGVFSDQCTTCTKTAGFLGYQQLLGGSGQAMGDSWSNNNYISFKDDTQISSVKFSGQAYRDSFAFFFDQYNRETPFYTIFNSIESQSPAFNTANDGSVGFAPYTLNLAQKDQNFMNQLKQNGVIDHNVVSFFIKSGAFTKSAVKFGSYDKNGLLPGQPLRMYQTASLQTWALPMTDFTIQSGTLKSESVANL